MNKNVNATLRAKEKNAEGHVRTQQEGLPGTLEELQALLQAEGDRRVTQALKTASERWQKELKERIAVEKAEAEKLAGLSLEIFEKQALERYANELGEKERALRKKELELKILYMLAENKVPLEFKEFIPDRDENAVMKSVRNLVRLWNEKLSEAIRTAISSERGYLPAKEDVNANTQTDC